MLKFMILSLLLASCANTVPKRVRKQPRRLLFPKQIKRVKIESCIEKFIRYEVKPLEALKICQETYK